MNPRALSLSSVLTRFIEICIWAQPSVLKDEHTSPLLRAYIESTRYLSPQARLHDAIVVAEGEEGAARAGTDGNLLATKAQVTLDLRLQHAKAVATYEEASRGVESAAAARDAALAAQTGALTDLERMDRESVTTRLAVAASDAKAMAQAMAEAEALRAQVEAAKAEAAEARLEVAAASAAAKAATEAAEAAANSLSAAQADAAAAQAQASAAIASAGEAGAAAAAATAEKARSEAAAAASSSAPATAKAGGDVAAGSDGMFSNHDREMRALREKLSESEAELAKAKQTIEDLKRQLKETRSELSAHLAKGPPPTDEDEQAATAIQAASRGFFTRNTEIAHKTSHDANSHVNESVRDLNAAAQEAADTAEEPSMMRKRTKWLVRLISAELKATEDDKALAAMKLKSTLLDKKYLEQDVAKLTAQLTKMESEHKVALAKMEAEMTASKAAAIKEVRIPSTSHAARAAIHLPALLLPPSIPRPMPPRCPLPTARIDVAWSSLSHAAAD